MRETNVKISQKNIKEFQQKIFSWYKVHKQDFPWRKTRDPYQILVSEVMLQQTQVSRVIPKFEAWLQRFPTVADLAKAPVSEVLAYWSGLGYNRRALFLKKTAVEITEKYGGKFPQDEKTLKSLPGIGEYTARAVLCFAFDKQITVVDTNVRKVILTQFINYRHCEERSNPVGLSLSDGDCHAPSSLAMTSKEIKHIADLLLPSGKAYDWNQALMDYSRVMLAKEKIPVPKQSKFLGSRRYYRGQILKLLLQKKKISINEIGPMIKKDFMDSDNELINKILIELEAEGFVVYKNGNIEISS